MNINEIMNLKAKENIGIFTIRLGDGCTDEFIIEGFDKGIFVNKVEDINPKFIGLLGDSLQPIISKFSFECDPEMV